MTQILRFSVILLITLSYQILNAQEVPRTLYVLNGLGRSISKMNLETKIISNNTTLVGNIPSRIYTYNELIYIVNSTPAGISVIDPLTDQVIKNILLTAGSNPWDMAFAGSNKAYVSNLLDNSLSILDLKSGNSAGTISVGNAPEGIIVENNTAFVTNSGGYPSYSGSSVSVVNIETDMVTKTLNVPSNPQDLDAGPDGNIYVVCSGNYSDQAGKIVIINPYGDSDYTPLVVDIVNIGGTPGDIIVTSSGLVWLADFGDSKNGFLYNYDIYEKQIFHDTENPVRVGPGAMQLFYDKTTDQLYVNNFTNDDVQLLDAADGKVLATYHFGDGAQDMAILEPISASDPWADQVVSFTPGNDYVFGYNYYPGNVLGPPDPDPLINEYNPSSKPQEILSLGEGGQIILEFSDNYIFDGSGPDFTVFENVFYFFGTTDPFIEAAIVSVSPDGINWHTFAWDTVTYSGFAGVTPTFNSTSPTDPTVSGGDHFDLSDVGLHYARYVKLTDLGSIKKEGQFNGDFDLDAVVANNSRPGQPSRISEISTQIPAHFVLSQNFPNPFNPETTIAFNLARKSEITLQIFNINGDLVATLLNGRFGPGEYLIPWHGKNGLGEPVASGIYFYRLKASQYEQSKRMLLIR